MARAILLTLFVLVFMTTAYARGPRLDEIHASQQEVACPVWCAEKTALVVGSTVDDVGAKQIFA